MILADNIHSSFFLDRHPILCGYLPLSWVTQRSESWGEFWLVFPNHGSPIPQDNKPKHVAQFLSWNVRGGLWEVAPLKTSGKHFFAPIKVTQKTWHFLILDVVTSEWNPCNSFSQPENVAGKHREEVRGKSTERSGNEAQHTGSRKPDVQNVHKSQEHYT